MRGTTAYRMRKDMAQPGVQQRRAGTQNISLGARNVNCALFLAGRRGNKLRDVCILWETGGNRSLPMLLGGSLLNPGRHHNVVTLPFSVSRIDTARAVRVL